MRMSDVMSSLGLALYPIVALAVFLSVFAGVIVKVYRRTERAELDRAAVLPLCDETPSVGFLKEDDQ